MSLVTDRLEQFQKYVALLKGDEKGEAQVFCDRLFLGFGHKGYKEAGAELEYRIKKNSTGGRSFADLVWKPRVLIEMKSAERTSTRITNKHLSIGYMPSLTDPATWSSAISISSGFTTSTNRLTSQLMLSPSPILRSGTLPSTFFSRTIHGPSSKTIWRQFPVTRRTSCEPVQPAGCSGNRPLQGAAFCAADGSGDVWRGHQAAPGWHDPHASG